MTSTYVLYRIETALAKVAKAIRRGMASPPNVPTKITVTDMTNPDQAERCLALRNSATWLDIISVAHCN